MSSSSNTSGGVGITGCLFLIFLVLKLAEVGVVAKWSWWWVCSPLWMPLAVFVPLILIVYVFQSFSAWRERSRRMKDMMD